MPRNKSGGRGSGSGGNETAVIVLGHGSRCSGAAVALARIAEQLKESLGLPVLPASLQFNSPTLAESCRELAAMGASRIVIAPYFLFNGNHLKQDIPGEVESISAELSDVELILAEHLGEDLALVEVLARRVAAAAGGGDREGDSVRYGRDSTGGEGRASSAPECAATTVPPKAIEAESFSIIDGLLDPTDAGDPSYQVSRRVVHATGDPGLAGALSFAPEAIEAGLRAFAAGAQIWCDVRMVASGVGPSAARRGLAVDCAIDDPRTVALAGAEGITRAAASMRLLSRELPSEGMVIAIGNAPTALFECLKLCGDDVIRPALVVGVPVGFVGAAESKQALGESEVPYITLPGTRGGSSVAVAIVNALLNMEGSGR